MICPDCQAEGRESTCVYDAKQAGEVCPRCQRVFSPLAPRSNFHYVTKKAMIAAMQKRKRLMNESTRAVVDRMIRERS